MTPKTIVALLAAVILTGCAGNYFRFDQVRQVRTGMTAQELQTIMGRPTGITARGDQEIWIYTFAEGVMGTGRSASFILRDGVVVEVPPVPSSYR